ncbi:MAG TPA: creatininase family protein [Longimicrobium sp.]|nr:creatininase family protein [Longimicrobium sp.]
MTAFPPDRSCALVELPWTAVAAHLAVDRRLIVPVGACDQHGPHLPLGAGTVVAEALACDLAREFGVLRAPTFHYGVNVPAERAFAGTASLGPKTLHRALNELLAAWAAQGFEEFIAITADLTRSHIEALATVRAAGARVRLVEALSVDLSQFLDEPLEAPEHAGEALTSLLLHLRPEAVRMERARDYLMPEEQARLYAGGRLSRLPEGCPGSVGRPTRASAEKGRRMYEHILGKIRHKVFIAPPEVAASE